MSADTSRRDELGKNFDAALWRSEQPYDGVLGTLPEWLPANFHNEFEMARNVLLRDGHTPDEIRGFVAELVEIDRRSLASPDSPPDINPSTPFQLFDLVYVLIRFKEAVRLGEKQGLPYLTDDSTARLVGMGKSYSQNQALKARQPRGKVSDNGETIGEIIRELAISATHEDELTKELWPHFHSELDRLNLNPRESNHPTDPNRKEIKYDFKDGRKSITYGQFANSVSRHRKIEKSV